jgi:hypothetical protein
VYKVSSNPELMPIQCHAKRNVLRRLLLGFLERLQPFRIISMDVLVKFLQITEQSARGGTYDNQWSRRLHKLPRMIPICSEAEVPTVREVERGAWREPELGRKLVDSRWAEHLGNTNAHDNRCKNTPVNLIQ